MKKSSLLLALLFFIAPLSEVMAATIDELHAAAIKFYGYQRAGTKTGSPYNPFYITSPYPHANDAYSGTALDGGWYDAGDFVKFGLPLGYAVYCLLKGYDAFPDAYDDRTKPDYSAGANTIPDILDEAKVGTDWMLKAVINASTIIRDVGNGNDDHQSLSESGYQNSSRIPNRTVYTCDGSDVPGYYAAALALMSLLYKPHDAAYATACLDKAKIAYAFGKSKAKVCGAQMMNSENRPFYVSETWQDKMACGGVELFRATGDSTYLREARTYISSVGQHYSNLGYAHAGDLAGFTFYRLGETNYASTWKQDVNYGAQRIIPASASATLVRGAFVNQTWGVASGAASFGFSTGLLYRCTGDNSLRDIAFQQLNWATGISPYTNSYLTRLSGGSAAGVQNPHHRNDVTLGAQTGKRLVGGLVSGPYTNASPFDPVNAGTYNWTFTDNSSNYTTTEVALDYNAGLVGLIAFKRWYDKSTCSRISTGLTTTPLDRVDFAVNKTVAITATLEKSLAWTVALKGQVSGATRQFTGTGTSINASWDGTATTGTFQSGESVDITLTVPDLCDYSAEKSRSRILVEGMPEPPIPASAVKVDDFEDNNLTNALSGAGIWEGFSDRSDSLTGAFSAKPALALVTGKSGAGKGVNFRLTATAGIANPYAGVKTWFNASKGAVSIGQNASSIIFDLSPTATGKEYRVELEQPDIADGAYFGATLTTGTVDRWARMVVPLSSLTQPAWKTTTGTLNKGNVKSIRFVMYGAGNSSGFVLDNVYVDNMQIGPAGIVRPLRAELPGIRSYFEFRSGAIRYEFPFNVTQGERWEAAVYSASGRQVLRSVIDPLTQGLFITVPVALPAGSYVLTHYKNGVAQRTPVRFVATGQ